MATEPPPLVVPARPPPLLTDPAQISTLAAQIDARTARDVGGMLERFVNLRANIAETTKRHKEELAPKKQMLELMENSFLKHLQSTNSDNATKKGVGCVYLKTSQSATIADAAAFRRHVIGAEDWELVDWRANAPAVGAHIQDTEKSGGSPPPGVNYSTSVEIGVRKA